MTCRPCAGSGAPRVRHHRGKTHRAKRRARVPAGSRESPLGRGSCRDGVARLSHRAHERAPSSWLIARRSHHLIEKYPRRRACQGHSTRLEERCKSIRKDWSGRGRPRGLGLARRGSGGGTPQASGALSAQIAWHVQEGPPQSSARGARDGMWPGLQLSLAHARALALRWLAQPIMYLAGIALLITSYLNELNQRAIRAYHGEVRARHAQQRARNSCR